MGAAAGGQPRLLCGALQKSVRTIALQRMGRLDRVRARVPAKEPRRDPTVPDDALPRYLGASARFRLTRALRRGDGEVVRRVQLSRRRRTRRRDRRRYRTARTARRHQGTGDLHGDITGIRPAVAAAVLHDRQRRTPRPRAARPSYAADRTVDEGCAHRRSRVQPRRSVPVGSPPSQRHRQHRPHGASLQGVDTGALVSLWDRGVRPGRIARRQPAFRIVWRDIRSAGCAHPLNRQAAGWRSDANRAIRFRSFRPIGLRVQHGWDRAHRYVLLHRRVERVPLRHRRRQGRRVEQRGDRIFPTGAPTSGREPDRVPLFGGRLRGDAHRCAAAGGRQSDHIFRGAPRRSPSGPEVMAPRLTRRRRYRRQETLSRQVSARRWAAPGIDLPDRAGIQGHRGRRRAREFLGPAAVEQAEPLRVVHPMGRPPRRRAHPPESRVPAFRLAREGDAERRGLLRSVRSDEDQPQGLHLRHRIRPRAPLR